MNIRNLYLLLPALLIFVGCNQSQFSLSGEFACEDGWVIVSEFDGIEVKVVDSFMITDGKFVYERPQIKTADYALTFPGNSRGTLILENGDLNVEFVQNERYPQYLAPQVTGGLNNELSQEYDQIRTNLMLLHPKYAEYFQAAQTEGADRHALDLLYGDAIIAFDKELLEKQYDFLLPHTDKLFVVSKLIFLMRDIDLDKKLSLYENLSDDLKSHPTIQDLKGDIDAVVSRQPGKPAPEFSLMTPDSSYIKLSSLKGQYVMLDFWASWCAPCRESFPHMKELYAKYHPKGFEILGITNDSRWADWIRAIDEDQIPWLQVTDEFPTSGRKRTAKVITQYGFNYLPSTLLIDPEGTVIGSFHGEELDQKLAEIFD